MWQTNRLADSALKVERKGVPFQYEGLFVCDRKEGQGTATLKDGTRRCGMWSRGKPVGVWSDHERVVDEAPAAAAAAAPASAVELRWTFYEAPAGAPSTAPSAEDGNIAAARDRKRPRDPPPTNSSDEGESPPKPKATKLVLSVRVNGSDKPSDHHDVEVRELEPLSTLVDALCARLGAIDGGGDIDPAGVKLQMDGKVCVFAVVRRFGL